MALLTLDDLLHEQVRELYSAERQYKQLLPECLARVTDEGLRECFADITEQVDTNIGCLLHVCQALGISPDGVNSEAMRGLVRATHETLGRYGDPPVVDAALIANAQRIAHLQIASYGTLAQFARVLAHERALDLLGDLTRRAALADQQLTRVATGGWFRRGVNQHAERATPPADA